MRPSAQGRAGRRNGDTIRRCSYTIRSAWSGRVSRSPDRGGLVPCVSPVSGGAVRGGDMDDRTQRDDSLEFLTRFGRRLSRRDVLKRALALGLSAPLISALLAACGGDDDDDEPDATATTGG